MSCGSKDIWVYAELRNGCLTSAFYELLSKARELKSRVPDARLCAVVLGWHMEKVLDELCLSGAEVIYCAEHEALEHHRCGAYGAVLAQAAEQYRPNALLFSASVRGSELTATVAAKLKTGAAAHCIDVQTDETGALACMVPAFGGKVVSEIGIPNHRPQIVSLGVGSQTRATLMPCPNAAVIPMDLTPLCADSGEEVLAVEPTLRKEETPVEEAEIVLCAGRGAAAPQTLEHLRMLAERMGATLGCTRSLMDESSAFDARSMIGVSGKSVKPGLYMSFGVSGASQHVCGIVRSRYIVSVDQDSGAKMFSYSDFGVVGDADRVICALLRRLAPENDA